VRDLIFPPIFLELQSLPNRYLSFYLSRRVGLAQWPNALYIVEICSFEYPLPPAARCHSFHPSLALRCAAAAYAAYARLTCSLLRPRPPTTFWNRFHWFASGAGGAGGAAAGVVAGSAGVVVGSDGVVGALAGVVAGSVGVVIGSNGGGLMGVALSGAYSGTPCRSTEPS